ncbi:hypothetical protein POPTR_018G055501v4 [Populus trichocarpa]|uniref:Uncharacterized protein n=1 Tax=Populus trichocarpa TaxID=3694 RepID=A0ACC0RNT4_POPTR|nr:hypothetical protein POPTR_018G055501v4 [Populus trichocarpa]
MASKLVQLQSKAAQASLFVAKHGGSYYRQLLEQNKQCIQVPPTVEKCDLLSKQLLYTRLARKELDSVKQLWKNRHELRVEDAGIAAWFGLVRLVVEVSHSLATGSICLRKDWGAARVWC